MAHVHEYTVHDVGVGLERSVCLTCGHVSIRPVQGSVADREQAVLRAFRSFAGIDAAPQRSL